MKRRFFLYMLIAMSVWMISACGKKAQKIKSPIPTNAVIYINTPEFQKTWTHIKSTQFANKLPKLKLWQEETFKGIFQEIQTQLKEIEEEIKVPLNEETIMSLFGKRVQLAFMPGTPFPTAVLITDLGNKSSALKLMDALKEKSHNVKTEQYEGYKITIIPLEPPLPELTYFFEEDELILTLGTLTAHQCINLLKSDMQSLLDTERFKQVSENGFHSSDNIFYIDMENIFASLKTIQPDVFDQISPSFQFYETAYVHWEWKPDGVHGNSNLKMKNIKEMEKFILTPSLLEKTTKQIPEDVFLASASAVDIKELIYYQMDLIKKSGSDETLNNLSQMISTLNETLGVDIEKELESWAGEGIYFVVGQLNEEGMFPLPDISIGIGIKEPSKALSFMHRIEGTLTSAFSDKHLQFSSLTIENNEFRYVPLPIGNNLSPGYGLIDDYLVISSSNRSFQSIMKSSSGKKQNLIARDIVKSSLSRSVGFQYFNSKLFFNAMNNVINRYRTLFTEEPNPDDLRELMDVMALIPQFYVSMSLENNLVKNQFHLKFL